jgi:hypothetical protein
MLFWIVVVCGTLFLSGAVYVWYLLEAFIVG